MDSPMINSSSSDLAQVHTAQVAENMSANASDRNSSSIAFSSHPHVAQATGVMTRKPLASSALQTYSSAISPHVSLIAEGPSGLVVLGSTLLSLALLIFFKCRTSGRRGAVQL